MNDVEQKTESKLLRNAGCLSVLLYGLLGIIGLVILVQTVIEVAALAAVRDSEAITYGFGHILGGLFVQLLICLMIYLVLSSIIMLLRDMHASKERIAELEDEVNRRKKADDESD